MPPSKTWKARERFVAALFGAVRNALSGRNSGVTASDSRHPRLFIEAKLRKSHTTWTLFRATAALAKKEKKIPVIALCEGGKAGALICVHSDDLIEFASQVLVARSHVHSDEPTFDPPKRRTKT